MSYEISMGVYGGRWGAPAEILFRSYLINELCLVVRLDMFRPALWCEGGRRFSIFPAVFGCEVEMDAWVVFRGLMSSFSESSFAVTFVWICISSKTMRSLSDNEFIVSFMVSSSTPYLLPIYSLISEDSPSLTNRNVLL